MEAIESMKILRLKTLQHCSGMDTAFAPRKVKDKNVVVEKFVPSLESLFALGFAGGNLRYPGNFVGMSRTPGGVQKVCAKICVHFPFPNKLRKAKRQHRCGTFPHFSTFFHFFQSFSRGLFLKLRAFFKEKKYQPFCTSVVARLSSSNKKVEALDVM